MTRRIRIFRASKAPTQVIFGVHGFSPIRFRHSRFIVLVDCPIGFMPTQTKRYRYWHDVTDMIGNKARLPLHENGYRIVLFTRRVELRKK